jgi:predicted porin
MKKSLFVLSMLASSMGAVQAQTSVAVYGIVDMGLKVENAGAGTALGLDSGNQSGSRVGFRGTEDLGGGLKANFVLEAGFNADTGANSTANVLFNRQSYVSLSGGFGEVKLGRIPTMVYSNSGVFDPFGDTLAGDSARIFNYGGSRTDNTVNYSFAAQNNGLNGQLAYSFGEVAGNTSANRTIAGALGYAAGPLAVVLTHQSTNNTAASDSAKTTLLGGNYNFGLFQPYAAYAVNKGVGTLDTRDALLGFRLNLAPTDTIMASVMHKYDKAIDHADATQLALGYTHDLSKRTNLYTSWSRLKNDAVAKYKVAAAGSADHLFNIGIRHKF